MEHTTPEIRRWNQMLHKHVENVEPWTETVMMRSEMLMKINVYKYVFQWPVLRKWIIRWNYEWMIRWNYEWMIRWKYKENFHFWYDKTPHRIGLNTHEIILDMGTKKKRLLSLRIYRLWGTGTPGWGRGPMATPDYNVASSLLTYL
jgi:hypothetical protein